MEQRASPQFRAGYQAGISTAQPMGDFEMFQYADDYVLGYVVGYSETVSFQQASPMAWSWQAGELGRLYRVPLHELERFIDPQEDFDGTLRRALRDSYHEAGQSPDDDVDLD